MIINSRREEDDEVELKVDVRQPSTFGRIVDMQAIPITACSRFSPAAKS